MTDLTALVQPAPSRLTAQIQPAPWNGTGGIGWGAAVSSLAARTLALVVCFPFKPGTLLAVRLEGVRTRRTVLARVQEAAERMDGNWQLGCELANALSDEELHELL
jgi:hypothetical protein